MPSRPETCPRGCFRFNKLPVGEYFMRCGKVTEARRARGEPVSAYKKVGGPRIVGGQHYYGGAVEMLLKGRGWGPAKRSGGMAAPYYPVRDNPCIRRLSREWALRYAEQRAHFKLALDAERRRRAG